MTDEQQFDEDGNLPPIFVKEPPVVYVVDANRIDDLMNVAKQLETDSREVLDMQDSLLNGMGVDELKLVAQSLIVASWAQATALVETLGWIQDQGKRSVAPQD